MNKIRKNIAGTFAFIGTSVAFKQIVSKTHYLGRSLSLLSTSQMCYLGLGIYVVSRLANHVFNAPKRSFPSAENEFVITLLSGAAVTAFAVGFSAPALASGACLAGAAFIVDKIFQRLLVVLIEFLSRKKAIPKEDAETPTHSTNSTKIAQATKTNPTNSTNSSKNYVLTLESSRRVITLFKRYMKNDENIPPLELRKDLKLINKLIADIDPKLKPYIQEIDKNKKEIEEIEELIKEAHKEIEGKENTQERKEFEEYKKNAEEVIKEDVERIKDIENEMIENSEIDLEKNVWLLKNGFEKLKQIKEKIEFLLMASRFDSYTEYQFPMGSNAEEMHQDKEFIEKLIKIGNTTSEKKPVGKQFFESASFDKKYAKEVKIKEVEWNLGKKLGFNRFPNIKKKIVQQRSQVKNVSSPSEEKNSDTAVNFLSFCKLFYMSGVYTENRENYNRPVFMNYTRAKHLEDLKIEEGEVKILENIQQIFSKYPLMNYAIRTKEFLPHQIKEYNEKKNKEVAALIEGIPEDTKDGVNYDLYTYLNATKTMLDREINPPPVEEGPEEDSFDDL